MLTPLWPFLYRNRTLYVNAVRCSIPDSLGLTYKVIMNCYTFSTILLHLIVYHIKVLKNNYCYLNQSCFVNSLDHVVEIVKQNMYRPVLYGNVLKKQSLW